MIANEMPFRFWSFCWTEWASWLHQLRLWTPVMNIFWHFINNQSFEKNNWQNNQRLNVKVKVRWECGWNLKWMNKYNTNLDPILYQTFEILIFYTVFHFSIQLLDLLVQSYYISEPALHILYEWKLNWKMIDEFCFCRLDPNTHSTFAY